ncbi:hypothetical protein ACIXNO_13310 [Bacteroides fragilis]|nr:hypothetical protein [Bacteroides fragilis]
MNEFNILFLGCFYPHYCLEDILTNTKGKCQFAADKLQWALIDGFIQNEVNLELLSFPVISTYPVGYKKYILEEEILSIKILRAIVLVF